MTANYQGTISNTTVVDGQAQDGVLDFVDQWGNLSGTTSSIIQSGAGYVIRFSNVSFNSRTSGECSIREQIDDETHFSISSSNEGFIDFTCYAGAQLRANCSFNIKITF